MSLMRAENAITARADQLLPSGLTVARWQVMKALGRLGGAATVPSIARELLLTRQAVQKQVDLLAQRGLVALKENPAHRKSPLVGLTREGHLACAQAVKRWFWVARSLGDALDPKTMEQSGQLLENIVCRLNQDVAVAED